MKLTESSLRNPAGVAAGVALIVLFGAFCVSQLPVQLFPDIENPQISIWTGWRAAAPREMEAEIVEPIEEVLQGLPGVEEMEAQVSTGWAWINLTFDMNTDMEKAALEVISRMNRMRPLPRDADRPVINLGGFDGGGPALTWFFLQLLPGNPNTLVDYYPLVEDTILPTLESIPGVSRVSAESGMERQELQVIFDPYRAAELGIRIPAMVRTLGEANDVSGGQVDVGRREYTLRFAGRYDPSTLPNQILEWRDGRPIRLGDIAEVRVGQPDRTGLAYQNGNPAIGIRIDKENYANVLETLNRVKAAVAELNEGVLKEQNLVMAQSFDSSLFIYRAIRLLVSDLFMGVVLAVGILWWFLRHLRATLIIALAIPVSLFSTFIVLMLTGRTLNVISLAGLAFAVGMVLDAAIICLENIVRLRQKGDAAAQGAVTGAKQVWPALVLTTTTHVAIFFPVLFLKDVEGQLFRDLALTIAIAVSISMVVAVTVVPLASARWLKHVDSRDPHANVWNWITNHVMAITSTARKRWSLIVALVGVPLVATWLLMPELDYLPPVKRAAVDSFFMLPPGANVDTVDREIVQKLQERLKPYMDGVKEPALLNYYILTWPAGGTMGVRVKDYSRINEMVKIINEEITTGLPDFMAFSAEGDLFGGFGGGREIPLHLQSRDPDALAAVAGQAMAWIREAIPESNVRADPGLEEAEAELRLIPNDRSLLEKGLTRADLGAIVRALGDGIYVGEYFDGNKRLDIILKSQKWNDPDELGALPLVTPGGVVPLGELATVMQTVGPDQVRRVDRRRTITVRVIPPENMSLEAAISALHEKVEPQIRAAMPADGSLIYGGSADRLKEGMRTIGQNFLMALLVLFVLMAVLFRSLKDSLLVMMSVPLATVGGVAMIRVLNLVSFQPLDLLTMIGFIILLGLVVTNAILLVDQARTAEREGMNRHHAVEQALRRRLRPIFMGSAVAICGMLPLLLVPGEGSVIYRGLAAAIVGGMSVNTIFTLVLLPCFLRMGGDRPMLAAETDPAVLRMNKKLESVA